MVVLEPSDWLTGSSSALRCPLWVGMKTSLRGGFVQVPVDETFSESDSVCTMLVLNVVDISLYRDRLRLDKLCLAEHVNKCQECVFK